MSVHHRSPIIINELEAAFLSRQRMRSYTFHAALQWWPLNQNPHRILNPSNLRCWVASGVLGCPLSLCQSHCCQHDITSTSPFPDTAVISVATMHVIAINCHVCRSHFNACKSSPQSHSTPPPDCVLRHFAGEHGNFAYHRPCPSSRRGIRRRGLIRGRRSPSAA